MKWSQLAPVGTKVLPRSPDYVSSPLSFSGFDHLLVNSGTAALGIILKWLRSQRSNKQTLTAVIPGYTCPDLVAACVYADIKPVIIDIDAAQYQFNTEQLTALTVLPDAIICPSLFGMNMDTQPLRDIVGEQTIIIEDNAQWFPEVRVTNQVSTLKNYALPSHTYNADFFITSFGRGKPVNLMGGGLLAWNKTRIHDFSPDIAPAPQPPSWYDTKGRLFNAICQPVLYGGLTKVPGMNLGATVYHSLNNVHRMDSTRSERVTASILAYLRQSVHAQQLLQQAVLPVWAPQSSACRLLRFPLLLQSKQARDHLLSVLNNAGLGASPMYARPLYQIEGVAADCDAPFDMPVSRILADRLLTLPVHANVKKHHIQRMVAIIDDHRQWLADTPPNEQ